MIDENFIWEVNRRLGRYRSANDVVVPTRPAIRQHSSRRRESSREMKDSEEEIRQILSREEWDCLAGELPCGEYENSLTSIIWMWTIQKKLLEDDSRNRSSNRMQMLNNMIRGRVRRR